MYASIFTVSIFQIKFFPLKIKTQYDCVNNDYHLLFVTNYVFMSSFDILSENIFYFFLFSVESFNFVGSRGFHIFEDGWISSSWIHK